MLCPKTCDIYWLDTLERDPRQCPFPFSPLFKQEYWFSGLFCNYSYADFHNFCRALYFHKIITHNFSMPFNVITPSRSCFILHIIIRYEGELQGTTGASYRRSVSWSYHSYHQGMCRTNKHTCRARYLTCRDENVSTLHQGSSQCLAVCRARRTSNAAASD